MRKGIHLLTVMGICMAVGSQMMAMPLTGTVPNLISPVWQEAKLLAPFAQDRGSYMHQGVDIGVPTGTPLYAVADGKITKAAPDSKGVNVGGGHMVFIDHGDGTESRYMHLETYGVKTGDLVKAGDLIGFSGMSGDATAPLLHYEYRIYGQPVDPYFIFSGFSILAPVVDTFMVEQQ